jgi:hypothetical protein
MMRSILVLILLFSFLFVNAQYFNNGQERSGIKWKKITSENFEVIYPAGFDEKAQKVAKTLEISYRYTGKSLNHSPKNISVILHTETVKSNAFLGWAPSRIEMYTTPHQQIYAQDWLEQLAIHEYRHMVQLSKIEEEMPKILRYLFGEQASALLTAAYIPFWFIEGDAVSVETGLSTSGRGRFPAFHRELKAQLIEKKTYSYDKAYLGSYKNHVPNYYQLGYFLVGGARMMFGYNLWDGVLSTIARKPLSLNAFNKGLKNEIGLKKNELYDTVFSTQKIKWVNELQSITTTPFDTVTKPGDVYADYLYPGFANDSMYVALRSTLNDVKRFLSIDENGNEDKLFTPGYIFKESASIKNNTIVWSERLPDIRWAHSDKSLLRVYTLDNRRLKQYKYDMKLFVPVLSPDNKQIAVVEATAGYECNIVLIDTQTGEIKNKIEAPENAFIMTPAWSSDNNHLYVVLLKNNKKTIAEINITNGKIEYLLPYRKLEVSNPVEYNDTIFFVCADNETDNLFALKKKSKKTYRTITTKFGMTNPSVCDNDLIFSFYTSDGFKVGKVKIDSLHFEEINLNNINNEFNIARSLAEQEHGVIDFSQDIDIDFETSKYRKSLNLFNIHSWAPVAIDPYNYTVSPGISVMSQNMLSTAEIYGGYRYKIDTKQGEFFTRFRYMGAYPVFDAEIMTGNKKSSYFQINQYVNSNGAVIDSDTVKKEFNFQHTKLSLKSYIPLNFSKGRYYRKVQPRVNYTLSGISNLKNQPSGYPSGMYHSIEFGVYAYHVLNVSKQDVLPNFGLITDISFIRSLPGVINYGSIFTASGILYLPGLHRNHGISVYGGYQNKDVGQYEFNDRIRYARGYLPLLNNSLITGTIDYKLPLFNPDFNVGRWVYFKRFKSSLFFDATAYSGISYKNETAESFNGTMRSTGVELTSDLHILRFIAPIEMGVRSTYLFDEPGYSVRFDFLFNINFTL